MQTRIQSMGEDLRAKTEAQEKVNQLQVHRRLLSVALFTSFVSFLFGIM